MTHDQKRRRTPRLLLLIAAAALALGFLVGPGVSAAQAQATPEEEACPIGTFVQSDGTTPDLVAYANCVAAFNASQGLPRTGSSEVGKYLGIGLGLLGLGAAFVWGSRRREHTLS